MSDSPQHANIVTLHLTATWFAVLIAELSFASSIGNRRDSDHSHENCDALKRLLMAQGGSKGIRGGLT